MVHSSLCKCFTPNKNSLPKRNSDGSTTMHVMRGEGLWYLNGVSKQYEEDYPQCLIGIITQNNWDKLMFRLNDCGITYFPCLQSILIAYFFAILTCGLSLLLPFICMSELTEYTKSIMQELNDVYFKPKGLILVYVRKCLRASWYEVRSNNEKDVLGDSELSMITNDRRILDEL